MSYIFPILIIYYVFESLLEQTQRVIPNVKKIIITLIIFTIQFTIINTSETNHLSFNFETVEFILKRQSFTDSAKLLILYLVNWIFITRISSNINFIKPAKLLFLVALFGFMALSGIYTYLFFILILFVLMDSHSKIKFSRTFIKYIFIGIALITAIINDTAYTAYFPKALVSFSFYLEFISISLFVILTDDIFQTNEGHYISGACIAIPFIFYLFHLLDQQTLDQSWAMWTFLILSLFKAIWDLFRYRGLKAILITRSIFLLLGILIIDNKYDFLVGYITMISFYQVMTTSCNQDFAHIEKSKQYLSYKWAFIFFGLSIITFIYFFLERLFQINNWVALILSFLSLYLIKDFRTIFLLFASKEKIKFIIYLSSITFLANIYFWMVR